MKVALVLAAILSYGESLKANDQRSASILPGDELALFEDWPEDIWPTNAPKQPEHWENEYAMASILDQQMGGCRECKFNLAGMWHTDDAPCKANFYFPVSMKGENLGKKKWPLISFVHGNQHGGLLVNDAYAETIFKPLVGAGYAVVATQSIGHKWCKDLLTIEAEHALTWLKSSPYSFKVDWDNVGMTGYSLGGRVTLDLAQDESFVKKWNIKFAAPLAPWCNQKEPCPASKVPTLFNEPFRDQWAPWCHAFAGYAKATSHKYWLRIPDTTHKEFGAFGKNRHMPCVRKGFDCYLKGSTEDCGTMANCTTEISPQEQSCAR